MVPFPPDGVSDGTVRLRLWCLDDLDDIVAACQDSEIPRWTRVPSPYTDADGRSFLSRTGAMVESGTDLPLALVDAETGTLLGSIGLHRIGAGRETFEQPDMLPDEIGYWLVAQSRGRGAATRGVRLLCEYAFGVLDRPTLWLQAKIGNERSVRVALRSGFSHERTTTAGEGPLGAVHVFRRGLERIATE